MAKKSESVRPPVFPYALDPKALRKLLAEIPKRPLPPKIVRETLKSWNVSHSNNSGSVIGVLKKIGFLNDGGVPNDTYILFMKTGTGPTVLADRIKSIYAVLYQNCHAPQSETDDELKKLFHIHTGGSDDVMRMQIQTFKALADYASFDGKGGAALGGIGSGASGEKASDSKETGLPPLQVALHIHLPENKSSRDYEAIIQDIAKYIYGREVNRN